MLSTLSSPKYIVASPSELLALNQTLPSTVKSPLIATSSRAETAPLKIVVPTTVVSPLTAKLASIVISRVALMSCTYNDLHCCVLVPRSNTMSLLGMILLSTSAWNTTLSVLLSPTLITPSTPALKNALPSTRKSPLMCTSLSKIESSSTCNVPLSVVLPLTVVFSVTNKLLCNLVSNSTSSVSYTYVASSTSSVPLRVVLPLTVVFSVTNKLLCKRVSSSTSSVS